LGAPLVLIHADTGNVLHFSALVAGVELGRPIWALEHPGPIEEINNIARKHVLALLEANPEGPHLLAGFCFGAIVAHEVACQLAAGGHEVRFLGLLGITPVDFPSVISTEASDLWRSKHWPTVRFVSRVRWHAERAFEIPLRERPGYVAKRVGNVLMRGLGRARASAGMQRALTHNPATFPGRALVVLHADDTAQYTSKPEQEWARLADEIEVAILPGSSAAMLDEPGLRALETLLLEGTRLSDAMADHPACASARKGGSASIGATLPP
jgi:thioesterase domain-containing protein